MGGQATFHTFNAAIAEPGMNGQRDEATRQASADVWAKARAANAGASGSPITSAGAQRTAPAPTASQKKSDDVWSRAHAKNQALRAHLDGGER